MERRTSLPTRRGPGSAGAGAAEAALTGQGERSALSPEGDAAAANDGSTFIKIREENLFAFNRASDEEFTSRCYTVPV